MSSIWITKVSYTSTAISKLTQFASHSFLDSILPLKSYLNRENSVPTINVFKKFMINYQHTKKVKKRFSKNLNRKMIPFLTIIIFVESWLTTTILKYVGEKLSRSTLINCLEYSTNGIICEDGERKPHINLNIIIYHPFSNFVLFMVINVFKKIFLDQRKAWWKKWSFESKSSNVKHFLHFLYLETYLSI